MQEINLVPRVLPLPASMEEDRGPWEQGWQEISNDYDVIT